MAQAFPPVRADRPVLVVGLKDAVWRSGDGTLRRISHGEAMRLARIEAPLLCHLPAVCRRLKSERLPAFDVLELWRVVEEANLTEDREPCRVVEGAVDKDVTLKHEV